MKIGAFLPEPRPGQAWVGTSTEFWECPWSWEQGVLHLPGWESSQPPASAWLACAVSPSSAEWSDEKLKHSHLETDSVAFLKSF